MVIDARELTSMRFKTAQEAINLFGDEVIRIMHLQPLKVRDVWCCNLKDDLVIPKVQPKATYTEVRFKLVHMTNNIDFWYQYVRDV